LRWHCSHTASWRQAVGTALAGTRARGELRARVIAAKELRLRPHAGEPFLQASPSGGQSVAIVSGLDLFPGHRQLDLPQCGAQALLIVLDYPLPGDLTGSLEVPEWVHAWHLATERPLGQVRGRFLVRLVRLDVASRDVILHTPQPGRLTRSSRPLSQRTASRVPGPALDPIEDQSGWSAVTELSTSIAWTPGVPSLALPVCGTGLQRRAQRA